MAPTVCTYLYVLCMHINFVCDAMQKIIGVKSDGILPKPDGLQ